MSAAPVHVAGTQPEKTGLGPSIDEIHSIQRAQAAHARTLEIERLSRQFPVVRELVEELAKATARIAELEALGVVDPISSTPLAPEESAESPSDPADDGAEAPKKRRGRKPGNQAAE